MALTQAQINASIGRLVRDAAEAALPFNYSRADITAAINAADQWATDNSVGYNAALPVPFRTTATASQKALLLAYVALRRAGQ
jgi:hypothetical protein